MSPPFSCAGPFWNMKRNNTRYILNAQGEPITEPDLMNWGEWMEHSKLRVVKQEQIGKVKPQKIGVWQNDGGVYRMGECSIILSGPIERRDIGWHFSIAHPSRHPTWEEQKAARYALVPDNIHMVSIMPPRSEFVNQHEHCFHWWEANAKFFKFVLPAAP